MMMNKQTEKRTENKTRFVNKLYNLKDVFEPDYIAWLIKKRFPTITNIKIYIETDMWINNLPKKSKYIMSYLPCCFTLNNLVTMNTTKMAEELGLETIMIVFGGILSDVFQDLRELDIRADTAKEFRIVCIEIDATKLIKKHFYKSYEPKCYLFYDTFPDYNKRKYDNDPCCKTVVDYRNETRIEFNKLVGDKYNTL